MSRHVMHLNVIEGLRNRGVCEVCGEPSHRISVSLIRPIAICPHEDIWEDHLIEWNSSPALWDIPARSYLKMLGIIKHPDRTFEKSLPSEFVSEFCKCGWEASSQADFESLHLIAYSGMIQYRNCPDCMRVLRAAAPVAKAQTRR